MSDVKALIAEARDLYPESETVLALADALEVSERALAFERLRQVDEALEASEQAPAVDREALARIVVTLLDEQDGARPMPMIDFGRELFNRVIASGILQDAAEVEARGLEQFAEFIEQTYPDDVFRPPSAETYSLANVKLQDAGLVLDSFSADLMRRAGGLARARAQQVREGTTPDVPNEGNTNG